MQPEISVIGLTKCHLTSIPWLRVQVRKLRRPISTVGCEKLTQSRGRRLHVNHADTVYTQFQKKVYALLSDKNILNRFGWSHDKVHKRCKRLRMSFPFLSGKDAICWTVAIPMTDCTAIGICSIGTISPASQDGKLPAATLKWNLHPHTIGSMVHPLELIRLPSRF